MLQGLTADSISSTDESYYEVEDTLSGRPAPYAGFYLSS